MDGLGEARWCEVVQGGEKGRVEGDGRRRRRHSALGPRVAGTLSYCPKYARRGTQPSPRDVAGTSSFLRAAPWPTQSHGCGRPATVGHTIAI